MMKRATVTSAGPTTRHRKGNVKADQHHLSAHMLKTKSTHWNFSAQKKPSKGGARPRFDLLIYAENKEAHSRNEGTPPLPKRAQNLQTLRGRVTAWGVFS